MLQIIFSGRQDDETFCTKLQLCAVFKLYKKKKSIIKKTKKTKRLWGWLYSTKTVLWWKTFQTLHFVLLRITGQHIPHCMINATKWSNSPFLCLCETLRWMLMDGGGWRVERGSAFISRSNQRSPATEIFISLQLWIFCCNAALKEDPCFITRLVNKFLSGFP